MLKNKCCLYVIISIRFFSITICNLLIEFPSYIDVLMVSVTTLYYVQTQCFVDGAITVSYWSDFCEIWWQEGRKEGKK